MNKLLILFIFTLPSCASSGEAEFLDNLRTQESPRSCILPFQTYNLKFVQRNADSDTSGSGRFRFQDPFDEKYLSEIFRYSLSSTPPTKEGSQNVSVATIEYSEITISYGLSNIFSDLTLGLIPYHLDRSSILSLTIRYQNKVTFSKSTRAEWTVYFWVLGSLLGFPLVGNSVETRQKEIIEKLLEILIIQANHKINAECK